MPIDSILNYICKYSPTLTMLYATPLIIRQALRFGQQSVILFFLLSGFVIYIATSRAESVPFRDYFIKRFRRIYPVMLGAFLVSFIISFIDGNFFELFNRV